MQRQGLPDGTRSMRALRGCTFAHACVACRQAAPICENAPLNGKLFGLSNAALIERRYVTSGNMVNQALPR
jgi:hypothetical protein